MWLAGLLVFPGVGVNLGLFPEAKQKQIRAAFWGEVLSHTQALKHNVAGSVGGHGPAQPRGPGGEGHPKEWTTPLCSWKELLIFSAGFFIWLIARQPARGSVHKGYLWRKFMRLTA